jgi:hypothetical protein
MHRRRPLLLTNVRTNLFPSTLTAARRETQADQRAKYLSSRLVSNPRSAAIRSLLRSPIHCHQNPPNGLNCYGFYLSRASAEFFDYTGGGIALFDFNRHHGHVIVKWLATTELTDRFQYLGDIVIDRERTRLIDHIANPGGLKLLIGRVG